ncbi:26473_t:CDS:1, partial [Racocetra persica]
YTTFTNHQLPIDIGDISITSSIGNTGDAGNTSSTGDTGNAGSTSNAGDTGDTSNTVVLVILV